MPFVFAFSRIDVIFGNVGIFFLIHYCETKIFTKFLSSKFWTIIDKLGLCIFICHSIILTHMFINIEKPIDEYPEWAVSNFYFLINFSTFFLKIKN